MRQTSTYYASLLHLYQISLHIILPNFIILPSRFYPHFLIKYWYAGLQLYSPILYPPLLRDILIRNMLTTAHQDLLYNFKCHPPTPFLIPEFISCFLTSLWLWRTDYSGSIWTATSAVCHSVQLQHVLQETKAIINPDSKKLPLLVPTWYTILT